MLTDLSPMTFGKYKGSPMQDIPVSYLHYLWHSFLSKFKEGDVTQQGKVATYIRENLQALKQENTDLLWQ